MRERDEEVRREMVIVIVIVMVIGIKNGNRNMREVGEEGRRGEAVGRRLGDEKWRKRRGQQAKGRDKGTRKEYKHENQTKERE